MPDANVPNTITGRDAFLRVLKDEGVTKMFGNPGTTELPIMHALSSAPEMGYVLALQEAVVIAMADGYARASGKLVSCNVHVAPGLGNAIGSIYTSMMSGTPMIVTAGQQEQGHGLTEPLLYAPLVPIAQPVVKWATEVSRIEDLPRILRRAAKVATTAPTGPVFISLPGDILNNEAAIDMGEVTRVDTAVRPSDAALEQLARRLLSAKKPVILAGHEIATSDAFAEATELAETLGAPVLQQTVAWGAHFPSEHPAYLGALNRDQKYVRRVLSDYDLMLCVGSDVLKMSVWSETEPLPETTKVAMIGLRDWEMGKNFPAEIALRADVKETLKALVPLLKKLGGAKLAEQAKASLAEIATRNWSAQRAQKAAKVATPTGGPLPAEWLMMRLSDRLPKDAIIVEEGLTSTSTLPSYFPFRDRNSFFGNVSGGIGWGIAAAVGVQIAEPTRRVVAVIGDGSAMYSISAIWSAANQKLPVIFLITNNEGYQILKNRLKLFHGNDTPIGMDFNDPPMNIAKIAEGFGLPAERVDTAEGFDAALDRALARTDGPTLIEAMVKKG
ncbi:thiamine pyrophosphate-binding protein [Reyranella sp.]|jgi:benzoylformate decarboxylase|uniref:thiamine pyrophosphate-binding protein n=1 Tax=Reyranella sp. TaxID=1929291 RepID=UPI000BC89A1B|nr:thiamine pyrophosphate-binding protein [Reyranella sp.]OYY34428.1 MAG: benzoylformate decarboxylase [Rhodospirillales bacterium 35-66-84]OYZ90996.1 MAG: benzoylformate decarboxylase [Rhodospirillales bacterium 24-66-33]OZB21492.1 MAG: benzoylformate decarboxylase [Rhodospirillales bacterium 39-66-50]HQS18566.1 thiamine pyrophosphate-binding protein [Reyranella sp.]HQT15387.1 thiamine pyrophosphate-binding protein [Reyranella sp.]